MHHVHLCSISSIHDHHSNFIAHIYLCLIQHKTDQLNEKYEELRYCLFKIKELNPIVLKKKALHFKSGSFV